MNMTQTTFLSASDASQISNVVNDDVNHNHVIQKPPKHSKNTTILNNIAPNTSSDEFNNHPSVINYTNTESSPPATHARAASAHSPYQMYHHHHHHHSFHPHGNSFVDDDVRSHLGGSIAGDADYDKLGKHQSVCRFFDEVLAQSESNFAHGADIASFLKESGFTKNDPRFKSLYESLLVDDHQYRTDIKVDDFISMIIKSQQAVLLERAFRRDLVCPDFSDFTRVIKDIFDTVKNSVSEKMGATASYIPQLGNVDPSLFGISVCTIDGQRFDYGDAKVKFCIQSCVKPLTYGMALEIFGEDKVHQHVGK